MLVCLVRDVLGGILSDESFAIQTNEMRTWLRIMRDLAKCFLQLSLELEREICLMVN